MRYFLLLTALFIQISIKGQTIDSTFFSTMKVRNIGPAGMSGRITAIDVHPTEKNYILAGSASGGLWESKNGGISWNPIFDNQDILSIGSVKFNPLNPAEIWVGTGEGNPRNSMNTGGGIFKSIDGGKSWKMMGLEKTKSIHRIIIDQHHPNTVYIGAIGSPWGPHPERGVYKTTDGGINWKKVLYVNDTTGVADLVVDPVNPNHLIAAMWHHRRTPWDFKSGGMGSGLYTSYDGGDTWKKLSDKEGLPKGIIGRMGIAFAPSKPHIVYALIEAETNGLYKSEDGGNQWKLVSSKNIGNRPFYYSEIYVDPKNENRIYNLWTYVSRSEDGGKSFETIMDYGNSVHPDHHAFWIDPDDPNYLIDGNDGGLVISRDGGATYQFAGNIPVGQFYHVAIDNDFPYNVYGGLQDNGSWIGPSQVFQSGGIRNAHWQELYFGDGFDVLPYRKDSRYGYAMSQGGNVGFYDRETGAVQYVRPITPDSISLRYNWNAPIAQDPDNDCGVYFGSQYVHYSDDCGMNWSIISPDLTTNDTTKQHQDKSGGLTLDATQAENHTTLLVIAPNPAESNVIWTGSDDGRLHISTDKGETWTDVTRSLTSMPQGSWIPVIHPSNHASGEAFVVVNDYRRNNYQPYLYHVTNYGKTARRIMDASTAPSFVTSVIQDPISENLLFAGTDRGLYVSVNKGQKWTLWDKGLPKVQISDLKIAEPEGDLVIGTFGRALWIMDDIRPLRALADGVNLTDKQLHFFEIAEAYLTESKSYQGVRFIAQGEYVGDNAKSNVANLHLFTTTKDSAYEANESKSKATFKVINSSGDTIRTFSSKLAKGLNQVNWSLNKDGILYPSRQKHEKNEDPPSGGKVLPGNYSIVVIYAGDTVMQNVVVKSDPRMSISPDAATKEKALTDQLNIHITQARKDLERIKKAGESIGLIKNLLTSIEEDSIRKHHIKTADSLVNILDNIEAKYFLDEDAKGIQETDHLLTSKLWRARSYISRGWKAPASNADIALANAIDAASKIHQKIERFFDDTWPWFQSEIDALSLSPFDLKPDKD